jgi:hypothetical protein
MQLLLNWQTVVGGDEGRPGIASVAPVVRRYIMLVLTVVNVEGDSCTNVNRAIEVQWELRGGRGRRRGVKHSSPRWDGVQFIAAGECSRHFSTCKCAEIACSQRSEGNWSYGNE